MPELLPIFSALSDQTRFAIFERLLRDGAQPAGALSEAFPVSKPAISRHLAVLREAGLISRQVEGTRRIYAARADGILAIQDWLEKHHLFWSESFDRLDTLIKKDASDA